MLTAWSFQLINSFGRFPGQHFNQDALSVHPGVATLEGP